MNILEILQINPQNSKNYEETFSIKDILQPPSKFWEITVDFGFSYILSE